MFFSVGAGAVTFSAFVAGSIVTLVFVAIGIFLRVLGRICVVLKNGGKLSQKTAGLSSVAWTGEILPEPGKRPNAKLSGTPGMPRFSKKKATPDACEGKPAWLG
jgi:hypothetical protein